MRSGTWSKHGYTRVLDVGCGAGFKLLTYLGQYETTGLEVGDTLTWLKENHPDRNWQESDFSRGAEFSADVVICSDVIEHLTEPDKLLKFLGEMAFKHLIISTPCRNILYHPWHRGFWGPPANECHAREWSFKEFGAFTRDYLNVVEHKITNVPQAAQMVICEKK